MLGSSQQDRSNTIAERVATQVYLRALQDTLPTIELATPGFLGTSGCDGTVWEGRNPGGSL